MAAPKKNTFWKLRSKHGRDKLFATPELLWKEACRYFAHVDKHPWYKNEQLKTPVIETNRETGEKKITAIAQIPTARPYTLSGLCLFLGVSESWWRNFKRTENLSEDFLTVISQVETTIETQQLEGATVGAFNANIISRKLGLADKTVVAGDKDNPIETKFEITLNLNK